MTYQRTCEQLICPWEQRQITREQLYMAYLGTGECEVWVLFHQSDRTGPAPGTLPDSLSIRPKPGYKETIDWSLKQITYNYKVCEF